MKRTFWTRNLFMGVLMGLVLAFSVPETADALTLRHRSGGGDLQMVNAGNPFTISFSVSLASAQTKDDHHSVSGQDESYYLEGGSPDVRGFHPSTVTDEDTRTDGDQPGDDRLVSAAAARFNNDQAISIEYTGFTVQRSGTTIPSRAATTVVEQTSDSASLDATTFSLHQQASGNLRLSSTTITLSCRAPSTAGAGTITIRDVTPTDDMPPNARRAENVVFRIFVVDPLSRTATSISIDDDGVTGGYGLRLDGTAEIDTDLTTAVPVTYSVTGGGRVFVQEGDRKGREASSLTTSAEATVHLDMKGRTNKVVVSHRNHSDTVIYIYGIPRLQKVSGMDQMGAANGRLEDPFVVKVTDSRGSAVADLGVTFDTTATPTTDRFMLIPGTLYGSDFDTAMTAKSTTPLQDTDVVIYTDSRGEAKIYYKLTASGTQSVTATAAGESVTFNPEIETATRRPVLSILSGNNQRTDSNGDIEDPLVVVVRQDGNLKPDEIVTFRTSKGTITGHPLAAGGTVTTTSMISGKRVYDLTNGNGEAEVTYYQDQGEGSDTVTATISGNDYEQTVTFGINGGSSTRPPTTREPAPPAAPTNRIGISLSSSTGEPGDEITITVRSDPSSRTVRLTSSDFADSLFSPQSGTTPFESTLTLPSTEDEYTITAEGFPLDSATATVTVETGIRGRITISAIGQPSNGTQLFTITVRDTDGDRISSALTVTVSGSGFTTTRVNTQNGIGDVRLTLPTTARLYTLTASAEDYTSGTTQVRITAPEQRQETEEEEVEEEEEEEAPEPASIEISGPATRSGTANTAIEAALLVRVLDADDDAVEDARVFFRVKKGRGELSQKGNRKGIVIQTDEDGYARAEYTPISASSTVEANVPGVRATVTFTITATGGAPSTDPPGTTPGTTRDTTSDPVSPTVLVAAAQRPPMLWVAGGKIYTLISTDVQAFVPSASNVMNIAIGGGKIYWTEKTSASSGTINSANLDGSDAKELKSIMAIPRGIAVDVPNSQLYWTNSRGRIQSANLDGSGIQNVMENIRNPNDLALAGGNVYWTESNHGSVRFVNLRGQKQVRVISTGDDPAGSLVIGGGKVYWTEKVGESGGTINVANLNGSGATELASILATPIGIAVDTARSKLYWTNARGRVQTASLSGSSIRNVVNGLESPGEILLSNSIKAPTTTPAKSTTTTAGKNKYDINADGAVDDKDVDAIIVAVAAKITTAKYDVNADGKVDFNDVVAVSANKESAASAPTLLGTQFSALEVKALQEQIDLLIASGDRSPAAIKTLIYLQQLIAMARPEKTQLLANYPNPFNPETWIPYELATDTNVKITIYNTQGVVIRTLVLGHQSAGYYTGRERAAYWDGRNAFGEQVASGIYFYQLETDEMSTLRKMVILK